VTYRPASQAHLRLGTATGVDGWERRERFVRKHMLAVPAMVALLAGSAVGVTAQDETSAAGIVTEVVEPGVERVIRDDAGHDLDEKHPTYRYDMDGVTITPDGTVWLASTYSREDNDANPPGGLAWALGQPGTLTIDARPVGPVSFHELSDGTLLLMAWGAPVATSDGDSTWTVLDDAGPHGGGDDCRTDGIGVTCSDASGEETTYLAGTPINQVAVAPDGTVWAVGGYEDDNGGLYHIWPE
jgi:hypothetical protein